MLLLRFIFHYGLAVLNRLLSTPPHGDAVTGPSLPHTANSAGGTFTRVYTDVSQRTTAPFLPLSLKFGCVANKLTFALGPFSNESHPDADRADRECQKPKSDMTADLGGILTGAMSLQQGVIPSHVNRHILAFKVLKELIQGVELPRPFPKHILTRPR